MLFDALDCGHVVGVMCNSDGHKGRPGAEGPGAGEFGIAGGLTCVLAGELSRCGRVGGSVQSALLRYDWCAHYF